MWFRSPLSPCGARRRGSTRRGVRSYLMTIVHNKAVDRIRQRGERPEKALGCDAPVAATAGDPEETLERASEREAVLAALANLSTSSEWSSSLHTSAA